jgi:hypothetical protein
MMMASNIDDEDAIAEDTEVCSVRWRTFTNVMQARSWEDDGN